MAAQSVAQLAAHFIKVLCAANCAAIHPDIDEMDKWRHDWRQYLLPKVIFYKLIW